jgi:hypothetical protein
MASKEENTDSCFISPQNCIIVRTENIHIPNFTVVCHIGWTKEYISNTINSHLNNFTDL